MGRHSRQVFKGTIKAGSDCRVQGGEMLTGWSSRQGPGHQASTRSLVFILNARGNQEFQVEERHG